MSNTNLTGLSVNGQSLEIETQYGKLRFFKNKNYWGVANFDVIDAIDAVRSTAILGFWKDKRYPKSFQVETIGGTQGFCNCLPKEDIPAFITQYAKCDLLKSTTIQLRILEIFEKIEQEYRAIDEAAHKYIELCKSKNISAHEYLLLAEQ